MVKSPARHLPYRGTTDRPELDRLIEGLRQADLTLDQPVLERTEIHKSHYMSLERDTIRTTSGNTADRDIVVHPGAVVIVPIDSEGHVLLVTQYRVPAGGALLELPAGTLDMHGDQIEDPLLAAHRELEEETGYRADKMERIGGFWSAPGFSTEYLHVYVATDLRTADHDRLAPDEDEELHLLRIPFAQAIEAAEQGVIEDAKSIAAILMLARRLERANR
jgi:ADP-ribose pyrophosphatase